MRIADVAAYAVKYPAAYIFTGTPADGSDYFLRPGFPTVYSTHNEALLVKVTADDGRIGWGEALAPVIPEAIAIIVARLVRPLILNQDPREVELLWDRVYDAMRVRGHLTGLYVDAIAAVDIALWDLAGQAAGCRSATCSAGAAASASRCTTQACLAMARMRSPRTPGRQSRWATAH